ncbi:MAG: N-terminal phage integrase SAM-like domain-containing protein [Bacilli bacterium]
MTYLLYDIRNDKIKSKRSINFYDFVKIWLKEYAEANVKASTLYGYRCNLNAYILPEFKDMRLNEIKALHLDKFYNKLKEKLNDQI